MAKAVAIDDWECKRMAVNAVPRRVFVRGLAAATTTLLVPHTVRAATPLVALVHTQLAGDNGPIDGMIASLKRIGQERSLITRAIYSGDPANDQAILTLLGEAGAAVVLVTFNEMTLSLRAVAPQFPRTRFIQLFGDPMIPPLPNVRTVSFRTYLGSYLSGMCGALLSQTGRIGFIGGVNLPSIDTNVNAQIAGAKRVRSDIDVRVEFVGSFQDPAKALLIANTMFASGIDYVQTYASGSDLGVIQAANARPGRILAGGSRPEFPLGPATMVAITLCDFERSLYLQTTAALGFRWSAGHYRSGLADGVVDFLPSQLFARSGPLEIIERFQSAWPRILAVRERIARGLMTVPYKTHLGP